MGASGGAHETRGDLCRPRLSNTSRAVLPHPGGASDVPFIVMAKPVGPICNLSCHYCYYLHKTSLFPRGERYRMSDEVLEAYVRGFIETSQGPLVHFVWHGGEPTLAGIDFYRRAVELQRRFLPQGWSCLNSLQTNGTLLNDAWCAFLGKQRFAVGISIDGPAHLHDASRPDHAGRPTHARVMRAFHLLRAHGIDPDVLCTLNALTATAPLDVYQFLLDEGVRWVQFIPVVERTPEGGVSARSVDPEAMGEFLCTVYDRWVRHDLHRIAVQGFLECLLVWSGHQPLLCTMQETCGRALVLEHDGDVYACDHFVDHAYRLGNVRSESLASLAGSAQQVSFGEDKHEGLTRTCRACPVLFACRGGCPKDRFTTAPDGELGHNYLCTGYKRFYMHVAPSMERIAALARERRPVASIMGELRDNDAAAVVQRWRHVGRNEPCPCGSGLKYKRCCLEPPRAR